MPRDVADCVPPSDEKIDVQRLKDDKLSRWANLCLNSALERFLEDGMETLGRGRWIRMDRHTAKGVHSVS